MYKTSKNVIGVNSLHYKNDIAQIILIKLPEVIQIIRSEPGMKIFPWLILYVDVRMCEYLMEVMFCITWDLLTWKIS